MTKATEHLGRRESGQWLGDILPGAVKSMLCTVSQHQMRHSKDWTQPSGGGTRTIKVLPVKTNQQLKQHQDGRVLWKIIVVTAGKNKFSAQSQNLEQVTGRDAASCQDSVLHLGAGYTGEFAFWKIKLRTCDLWTSLYAWYIHKICNEREKMQHMASYSPRGTNTILFIKIRCPSSWTLIISIPLSPWIQIWSP